MIYKFKSKAAGDLIMLEPTARRLLQIIGKDGSSPGIVLPQHMAEAVAALQEAVRQDAAAHQQALALALSEGRVAPKRETPGLAQRALPFIDLLRRCQQANESVVWGV